MVAMLDDVYVLFTDSLPPNNRSCTLAMVKMEERNEEYRIENKKAFRKVNPSKEHKLDAFRIRRTHTHASRCAKSIRMDRNQP